MEFQSIVEILKYIIPSIVVLIACNLIINRFLSSAERKQQVDLLKDNQDTTLRLRLQAYERLVLYIERIHPRSLVPRVYVQGMNVAALQHFLVLNIRTELEHNLSQQVYVSKKVWETIRSVTEQEISMISSIAQQMNPEDPGTDLHKKIIDYVVTIDDELPTDVALQIIHDEAKLVLSYGSY